MATPFYKSYDDIMEETLTSYKNLDTSPDVGVGSMAYIQSSVQSQMGWGLYRYMGRIALNQFVDTMTTDALNHKGAELGILRLAGETDAQYKQRILVYLQSPPAGGTASDYRTWALSAVTSSNPIAANLPEVFNQTAVDVGNNWVTITQDWVNNDPIQITTSGTMPSPLVAGTTYYVLRLTSTTVQFSASAGGSAIVLTAAGSGNFTMTSQTAPSYYVTNATIITPMSTPTASLAGSVYVILVPNDETILDPASPYHTAGTQLASATFDYIEARRPVTASSNLVIMETIVPQQITMEVGPLNAPIAQITADIDAYMNTLNPGYPLYVSQLEAVAVNDGATHVTVLSPGSDIFPAYYGAIRAQHPINVIAVP